MFAIDTHSKLVVLCNDQLQKAWIDEQYWSCMLKLNQYNYLREYISFLPKNAIIHLRFTAWWNITRLLHPVLPLFSNIWRHSFFSNFDQDKISPTSACSMLQFFLYWILSMRGTCISWKPLFSIGFHQPCCIPLRS
jgi:hypothetical protein